MAVKVNSLVVGREYHTAQTTRPVAVWRHLDAVEKMRESKRINY